MNSGAGGRSKSVRHSRVNVVLILFLGVIAYFLWMEHRAHVIQALPWLFLLACPFLHLFMHHGHGHRAGHSNHVPEDSDHSKRGEG